MVHILVLVRLTRNSAPQAKNSFSAIDLIFVSLILLIIFAVYIYKLVTSYAKEEEEVRVTLSMSQVDIENRLYLVYQNVKPSSFRVVALLFWAGIFGAFVGGNEISDFSTIMIQDLEINPIL